MSEKRKRDESEEASPPAKRGKTVVEKALKKQVPDYVRELRKMDKETVERMFSGVKAAKSDAEAAAVLRGIVADFSLREQDFWVRVASTFFQEEGRARDQEARQLWEKRKAEREKKEWEEGGRVKVGALWGIGTTSEWAMEMLLKEKKGPKAGKASPSVLVVDLGAHLLGGESVEFSQGTGRVTELEARESEEGVFRVSVNAEKWAKVVETQMDLDDNRVGPLNRWPGALMAAIRRCAMGVGEGEVKVWLVMPPGWTMLHKLLVVGSDVVYFTAMPVGDYEKQLEQMKKAVVDTARGEWKQLVEKQGKEYPLPAQAPCIIMGLLWSDWEQLRDRVCAAVGVATPVIPQRAWEFGHGGLYT